MTRRARTFLLVASALGAAASIAVLPRSAPAQPGADEDLRAAYATAADIAEGKRVAQAQCAGCHGLNGISRMKDIPHLAGQRPAYVYHELRVYQGGGRGKNLMSEAVKFLNGDALYKVAAYYASLDPAPPAAGKPAPAKPDAVQAGKSASAACAGCHGDSGVSKTPGTPSLAGLDPKYLVAALHAYKGGRRKNDVMNALVASLGDADLSNLSLYYALQKPARSQTPSGGDPAAGKAASEACAGCHGEKGASTNAANPSLAGQDAQYLAAALRAYKDGSRVDETMKGLAATLDDTGIKNVAAYYASQEPQPAKVARPRTTAQWAERCDRCHGAGGNSTDPRLPALAAQREDYLVKVLHAYRKGERTSPQMAAMSAVLTETDVENLAAHYAHQKARAAVYIVLPPR
jgi:cytochrome c553